jgi:cysteine desulfuration protein SufE
MTIDEIIDKFSLLDDWDDRYRYVIELGRGLAPLDEWDRNQAGKVRSAQAKFGWRRRFARTEGMVRCCRSRATAMPISCAD